VAAGVGLGLFRGRTVAEPRRALLTLRPASFQTLVAFAGRVVTPRGADPVEIAHGVDALLACAPQEAAADFNQALGLLESAAAGLLLDGRMVPFTRLGGPAQDAAIEAWRHSHLGARRAGYQAMRKLCLAAHYALPTSWGPLKYQPPTGLNRAAYPDSKAGTPEWLAAEAAAAAPAPAIAPPAAPRTP
jgi:hypothetical protein